MKEELPTHKYKKYYDEKKFIVKLKKVAAKLSREVVLRLLILYQLLRSGKVPLKTRILIVAALGYFLLPSDLISDFIPALGFSDDIAFLTYAFNEASKYADASVREKAEKKLETWLAPDKKQKESDSANQQEDAVSPG